MDREVESGKGLGDSHVTARREVGAYIVKSKVDVVSLAIHVLDQRMH